MLGILLAAVGCHDRLAHFFGGYAYDATQDCLDPPGVVDVVAGPDPGQCPAVRCWQGPDGSIYVTSEACDAPPDYEEHTGDMSGPCVKALAAYADAGHDICPTPADAGGGL